MINALIFGLTVLGVSAMFYRLQAKRESGAFGVERMANAVKAKKIEHAHRDLLK